MNKLCGVADVHPLLVQRSPHAVQLGNACLCQAAPVLAQVVHIQITDVLFVSPQLLEICTAQVAFIQSDTKTRLASPAAASHSDTNHQTLMHINTTGIIVLPGWSCIGPYKALEPS